jgi:putative addiction module component (TIGR02574 family)
MTEIAEKLKGEALQLDEEDRAELAYQLLRSLDEQEDDDTCAAWESELERRLQEMEEGSVRGIAAEDALAEMRKKYP